MMNTKEIIESARKLSEFLHTLSPNPQEQSLIITVLNDTRIVATTLDTMTEPMMMKIISDIVKEKMNDKNEKKD